LRIRQRQVVHAGCICRCRKVARDEEDESGGATCAQRRIAVRCQRLRMMVEAAAGQRAEAIGCWRLSPGVAVVLSSPAATSRSPRLRLQHPARKTSSNRLAIGRRMDRVPIKSQLLVMYADELQQFRQKCNAVTVAAPVRPKDVHCRE